MDETLFAGCFFGVRKSPHPFPETHWPFGHFSFFGHPLSVFPFPFKYCNSSNVAKTLTDNPLSPPKCSRSCLVFFLPLVRPFFPRFLWPSPRRPPRPFWRFFFPNIWFPVHFSALFTNFRSFFSTRDRVTNTRCKPPKNLRPPTLVRIVRPPFFSKYHFLGYPQTPFPSRH